MKLSGRQAAGYIKEPDPAHAGVLLFGMDAMRVADARARIVSTLIGPDGADEMRLTRIAAADLRKDPAQLQDAMKAVGFFPGHRVALVEDATDGLAKLIGAALADWAAGDATVIVTAGSLTAKSALRKVFEPLPHAVSIGLYDDPPSRDDVAAGFHEAGIPAPQREVLDAAFALAQTLEPGDFRQTLEKLALYKHGDDTPVTLDDLAANAPQSAEATLDDVLDAVASGAADRIGPQLSALYAQGVQPITLSIGAMRHFRRLHQAASDPGGAAAGAGKLRPPVFGPRRDKLVRHAGNWGRARLETALQVLLETDLALRSAGQTAPQTAVMERSLIRLAMLGRR